MAALLAAHAFGPIPAAQAHSGCAELAATVSKATYVQESPYHEIVQKLVDLIEANGWQADFEAAIQNAQAHEVPAIGDVRTLDDYLNFVNLTRGLVVIDSPIG